jgi:hypothetical protein
MRVRVFPDLAVQSTRVRGSRPAPRPRDLVREARETMRSRLPRFAGSRSPVRGVHTGEPVARSKTETWRSTRCEQQPRRRPASRGLQVLAAQKRPPPQPISRDRTQRRTHLPAYRLRLHRVRRKTASSRPRWDRQLVFVGGLQPLHELRRPRGVGEQQRDSRVGQLDRSLQILSSTRICVSYLARALGTFTPSPRFRS